MKRWRKTMLCCAVMLAALLWALPAYAAGEVQIVYPSAAGNTIASGCDFYVIGTYDTQLAADSLTVELFPAGDGQTALRTVYRKQDDGWQLNYDYAGLSYYGADRSVLAQSYMPDLVYDPAQPQSFKEPWRKACFGKGLFTALLSGGLYDRDVQLVDQNGRALQPLAAGQYQIKVTVSVGEQTYTATQALTIGSTADKLCARFSPAEHYAAATEFAQQHQFRVYTDPFAGYWSADNLPVIADSGLFAEILPRWHLSEYQEYATGTVHAILYNISASCATNKVEFGTLQQTQRVDEAQYYYYELGEPTLQVGGLEQTSTITQLADTDALALTRIEAGGTKDNFYDLASPGTVLTTDEYANKMTVIAKEAGALTVYGVVTPVQNLPAELTDNGDYTYTAKNSVQSVRYTVKDQQGKVLDTLTKEIGLTRQFTADKQGQSLYEFAHVLDLAAYQQSAPLTIELVAVDSNGQEVAGSASTIAVQFSDGAVLKLYLDQKTAYVNGQAVALADAPYVATYQGAGYTMVPLRFIGEQGLGATVGWDKAKQQVTVTSEGKTLTLTVGQSQPAGAVCPPQVREQRLFVPVRYLAEALGCTVQYQGAEAPIVILAE